MYKNLVHLESILDLLQTYRWADLPLLLGLALVYALSMVIVLTYLAANANIISMIWVPGGIGLASLLIFGNKYWPGIFLGSLFAEILLGNPALTSVGAALSNTIEPLLAIGLLKHGFQHLWSTSKPFNSALLHPYDYFWLTVAAAIAATVAALIGIFSFWQANILTPGILLKSLQLWWMGNMLGMVVVTPILLVWQQAPQGWFKRERLLETIACFGLSFLAGQIIMIGWFNETFGFFAKGFFMFVFVAWSAVRFGRHGVLLVLGLTTVQALIGALHGTGYFAQDINQTGLINLWFYILVLTCVGLQLSLLIHNRTQAEKNLRKMSVAIEQSPAMVVITDLAGTIEYVNPNFSTVTGYSAKEAIGQNTRILKTALTPAETYRNLWNNLNRGNPWSGVFVNQRKNGDIYWEEASVSPIKDADGITTHYVAVKLDITKRKRNEELLRQSEEKLRTIIDATPDCVKLIDSQGILLSINAAGLEMIEADSEQAVISESIFSLIVPEHREAFRQFNERICQGKKDSIELEIIGLKGTRRWLETRAVPLPGKMPGELDLLAITRDITSRKANEDLVWKQANFDPLTELPNRHMFYERLQQEIKKAHRDGQSLALLFLDLDHFKEINDTLGHDIGDLLLKQTAQRLLGCVRETDTVSRLGGDEFTIILTELIDVSNIDRITQSLLKKIAEPFELQGEVVYISVSIGITLYPDDTEVIADLLKNADQSMYAAKNLGRNQYSYFTPVLQSAAITRMHIAKDLRVALAEQQFWIVYQPIVELASGAIHKAEALLRWQHPTRGVIYPAEFISIAEKTGLIIAIGDWVFRQAAQKVLHWRATLDAEFQISINKSPVQFHNEINNHSDWIEHLQQFGLPGQSIVIEITEGLLLDVGNNITEQLIAFRDAHIQVSLDDFGTGYSSLSYLKKLHIDYLKIDKSFVHNIATHPEAMALCEAIVAMAHTLDIKVIAEGVETITQRDLLLNAGCDYGQGYLFSKPVPEDEFERFLAIHQSVTNSP